MIGQHLIKNGLISSDQLQIALVEQKKSGKKLGELLVQFGFVSEHRLRRVLGKMAGIKVIDLARVAIDSNATRCVPEDIARRLGIVPVRFNCKSGKLIVAMSDTSNLMVQDQLGRLADGKYKIQTVMATESDIALTLDCSYGSGQTFESIVGQLDSSSINSELDISEGVSVVRLVNFILEDAVRRGSSDIHLEPESGFVRIRFRVDGVLTASRSLHFKHWSAIAGRIKVQAGMDIAERRKPQDGSFSQILVGKRIDFRVSSFPVLHGENMVLRILDRNKTILLLDALQQPPVTIQLVREVLAQPDGVVLVAGPTGSGKTSTLYSMISEINTESVNIMTLEDPVEYPLELVRQSSLGQQSKISFHEGVRAILRQDPDVVLIGEVRDKETAQIAMRAAMTGHKVFSTIHTRSSIAAIQRLIDLGVESSILTSNLAAVISQRLVRLICHSCKELAASSQCADCAGSGYKGRVAVMEVLRINELIAQLFFQKSQTSVIREEARKLGWVPMAESAQQLADSGQTDSDEINRVFGVYTEDTK